MAEKVVAYIINESVGVEQTPVIVKSSSTIVRFRVPVLQEADVQNRNGRIYSWEVLTDGVNHSYLQERLRTGTLYSECGHPREQSIERQIHIDRDNVSCIIKDISMMKPYVVGNIVETASTAKGRDFRGLIVDNGCKVAFSMRGLGRVVEQNGSIHVQKPLRIVTWDDVVHPSVKDAYMGDIITAENSEQKLIGESLTVLNESAFTQFIFESSPGAQNTVDAMNIDMNTSKMSINEDGLLVIDDGHGFKLVTLTEGKLRGAMDEYLVGIGKRQGLISR
jgi:hypothetical protein